MQRRLARSPPVHLGRVLPAPPRGPPLASTRFERSASGCACLSRDEPGWHRKCAELVAATARPGSGRPRRGGFRPWVAGLTRGRYRAAVRSCTCSLRRPSTAGSVSGSTPWPRLNMWPGRPPASARMRSVSAATRSNGPRSRAGSDSPARRDHGRPPASPALEAGASRGPRRRPGCAELGEQMRGPGGEVDRRHVDGRRMRAEYGATNSR